MIIETNQDDVKRILATEETAHDDFINLRPQRLQDFIGQEKLKKNLQVFIEANTTAIDKIIEKR